MLCFSSLIGSRDPKVSIKEIVQLKHGATQLLPPDKSILDTINFQWFQGATWTTTFY